MDNKQSVQPQRNYTQTEPVPWTARSQRDAYEVVKFVVRKFRNAFPEYAHIPVTTNKNYKRTRVNFDQKYNHDAEQWEHENIRVELGMKMLRWFWENGDKPHYDESAAYDGNDIVYGTDAVERVAIHELAHVIQMLQNDEWHHGQKNWHGRTFTDAIRQIRVAIKRQ